MNDSLAKTPLSRQNSFYGEKVKFLNWMLKWICNNSASEELPFDIPEIAAVLQAMGFQLEKLERTIQDSNNEPDDESKIKITLHCTKSKMSAVLAKSDLICKCPNSEAANDGSFWIVSGGGPSTSQECINKVSESSSSLLPIIPRGRSMLIKEIIFKLLTLVNATDINKNDEKLNTTKQLNRGQSLENLCAAAEKIKPLLTRQQSWEVDPKTSPPASTSSPLPELCKTLEQMSVNDRDQILVELLSGIEEKIKKAISLLPTKNNTFTMKKTVKRVSNIRKSPVLTSPTRSTTGACSNDLPVKITPNKVLTPKKTPQTTPAAGERKLYVPSKISSFRKKFVQTPTPDKTKIHKDTPIPTSATRNRLEKKLNPLAARPPTFRSSNPNLASPSSSSGINKIKSGIPSFGSKLAKPTSISGFSLKKPK